MTWGSPCQRGGRPLRCRPPLSRRGRAANLSAAHNHNGPEHANMPDSSTPLLWPELGEVYRALTPWAWAGFRAVVGLALVPHGLRLFYGFFKGTGSRLSNFSQLR